MVPNRRLTHTRFHNVILNADLHAGLCRAEINIGRKQLVQVGLLSKGQHLKDCRLTARGILLPTIDYLHLPS